ncbi:MAG TPA: hypothetical protein VH020_14935 [Stellaceae bacterium]|jgi:hypothetical protein|nr:hypothetical protein [Stellaceae bacterium]
MTRISDYNARGVGVPWVRKEDYEAFLLISEDAQHLPETWEKFVLYTEMSEQKWKAEGYVVERTYIDPETFPDWCAAHGCRVDTEGRKRFAASVVADKYCRSTN